MTEKRFFPASIVDDITYCTDRAYANLSLNDAWILTLEGEVSTEVSQRALDDTLHFYPKARCILVNSYPSYKRWFRHCWQYTNTTGKDILEEIQLPPTHTSSEEAVNYYIHNHARFSIDPSYQVPLKVVLLRAPLRVFLFFIMHHAVADALGGFFFIQKFIQCYEDILYQRVQAPPSQANFDGISSPEVTCRWSNFFPRNDRSLPRAWVAAIAVPATHVVSGGKLVAARVSQAESPMRTLGLPRTASCQESSM